MIQITKKRVNKAGRKKLSSTFRTVLDVAMLTSRLVQLVEYLKDHLHF